MNGPKHSGSDSHSAKGMAHTGAASDASDWKSAFKTQTSGGFGDALADDIVLEASVLYRPIAGRENVTLVMTCASKIYERLEFTKESADGQRRYVEWQAHAFGGVELKGVTIITRNDAGAIAHLAIHHRPLAAALRFSAELAGRLDGAIDDSHFLAASDLPHFNAGRST